MKSNLIKDTTKEERIALIKAWIPVEDGLDNCEIDLWDMYRDYINGEKEIAEINAEFHTSYYSEQNVLGDRDLTITECKNVGGSVKGYKYEAKKILSEIYIFLACYGSVMWLRFDIQLSKCSF